MTLRRTVSKVHTVGREIKAAGLNETIRVRPS